MKMKIYDLDNLSRDIKQSDLYNLFELTFKSNQGYKLSEHIVSQEEEMRSDLVCNSIYNNIDHIDFILNLNDIDNPLNIMDGDSILYTEFGAISDYKISSENNNNVRQQLTNVNKSTKIDSNRTKYVDDNYSLPPTFLETPNDSVKIEDGQIIIGGK